jgi:tetratricopeptide (TPR) repeat protein
LAIASLFLYLEQRLGAVERELVEQKRISDLRDRVRGLHLNAQEAADRDLLPDARASLLSALEIIATESVLADMESDLEALRTAVAHKEEEQKAKQQAGAEYDRLFELRDTAVFHGMVFEGVDLSANVEATRQACRDALDLFGVSAAPIRGPTFSTHLSAVQKRRCNVAFYELLLVWAEAVAQTTPGRGVAARPQLEEALRLLDRAALLDVPTTKAFHLRRAGYLESLGDAEAGRRERRLAARSDPRGALDHFLIGDSHQKGGRLEEAAKEFASALRAEPDHFWAGYFLGVCNLQLLRPAQARDNFTACLASKNTFLWLYLFRGFANGQLNDFAAADEDYCRALASKPEPKPQALYGILVNQGTLALHQARQADEAVPMFWPAPLMPNLVPVGLGAARVLAKERLAAGAAQLERAVALQPGQYPAYRYLAMIRHRQKRFDDAATQYGHAIRAAKDQGPLVLSRLYGESARLHREWGNPDAALEDLALALNAAPRWEDHFERGRILHQQGVYLDALAAYEDALRLRPVEATIFRAKADALRSLERYPEAAAALDRYLANGGKPTAEVYRMRGRLRARLERLPAALADYTQSLDLEPHAETYVARAWVFLANEAQNLALRDFEEAIRLDPENGEAYAGRGLIRVRLGRPAEARADAEAAVRPGRTATFRLLWNTAHVYSQLAKYLGGRAEERNPRTGWTKARCQEQAVKLLRDALESVPAEEQKSRWRDYIREDVYLDPIRGTAGFERLEREYGK